VRVAPSNLREQPNRPATRSIAGRLAEPQLEAVCFRPGAATVGPASASCCGRARANPPCCWNLQPTGQGRAFVRRVGPARTAESPHAGTAWPRRPSVGRLLRRARARGLQRDRVDDGTKEGGGWTLEVDSSPPLLLLSPPVPPVQSRRRAGRGAARSMRTVELHAHLVTADWQRRAAGGWKGADALLTRGEGSQPSVFFSSRRRGGKRAVTRASIVARGVANGWM